MRSILALGLAVVLFLAGCAGSAMTRDCLESKQQMDQVAIRAGGLQKGLTPDEVRTYLGNPVEIVWGKGMGDFDVWKYYLVSDCRAYLGERAPHLDLFFLGGKLVKWDTFYQK
jgi:hypothetical protein